jgi:hypothetical protein
MVDLRAIEFCNRNVLVRNIRERDGGALYFQHTLLILKKQRQTYGARGSVVG